jgi:hypothetical protein
MGQIVLKSFMTKIHKKIRKARQLERNNSSEKGITPSRQPERRNSSAKERKAGVAATIRSHDFRFRDQKTLEGLGLDAKAQKRMARVKRLVAKK